jgi:predicted component of type VI protein secretion system
MSTESYSQINWNGIQVLKNDLLTGRTMVVSPEVFEMLTETPEQRQAKARALVRKADQLMALCDALTKGHKE